MENEELFNNDADQNHNKFIDAVVPTLPNVFEGLDVDPDRLIRLGQACKRDQEMEEIETLKSELAAFNILELGQDAFEVKKELLLKLSVDAFARLMYLYRSQSKLGALFNLSGQILKAYIEKKKSSHPHHFRLFNLTCQEKEASFVLDFLNRHKAGMTLIDFHKENIDNIRRQDDKTCDKLYFAMMPQQDFASLLLEFEKKDNFFSYFGFNKENMRIFFLQKKSTNWQLFAPNPAKKMTLKNKDSTIQYRAIQDLERSSQENRFFSGSKKLFIDQGKALIVNKSESPFTLVFKARLQQLKKLQDTFLENVSLIHSQHQDVTSLVGEYKKLLFSYSNEELGQLAFSSPSSKVFFKTYKLSDITFYQLANNANGSTNSVEDQARLSLIQKIFYTEEPIRKIRYLNYLVPEPSDPSHRVEYIENCLQALDHWSNQSNFYKKMHLAELSKKDLCLLVDSYKSSNTSMEEQLQIPVEDIVPFLR